MDKVWSTAREITAVDLSTAMLDVLQKLAPFNPKFSNLEAIRTMSSDKYNMVIASHVLTDLPDDNARAYVVKSLWNAAEDMLVFIDRGNPEGYRCILNARSFILKQPSPFHIVAPVENYAVSLVFPRKRLSDEGRLVPLFAAASAV